MKRFTKVCLVISLVVLLLGMSACAVGVGLGFSFQQLDDLSSRYSNWFSPFSRKSVTVTETMEHDYDAFEYDDFDAPDDDHDVDYEAIDDDDYQWIEKGDADEEKGGPDWDIQTYTYKMGDVHSLDLSITGGEIVIRQVEDAKDIKAVVEYRTVFGNKKRKITCDVDNGTLKIEDNAKKLWNNLKKAYVTLEIPKGQSFKDVKLVIGACEMFWDGDLMADNVKVEVGAGTFISQHNKITVNQKFTLRVGAGDFHIEDVTANKMTLECGVGDLSVSKASVNDLIMECGLGDVSIGMVGDEQDYNYDISCGLGSLSIGSMNYGGIGTNKKIDNKKDKSMKLTCGLGNIDINFIDFNL